MILWCFCYILARLLETEHKFKSQLAKCDAAGVFHFHSDIERNSITAVEQFDERGLLLLLLFLLFLLLLATLPLYHLTKTLYEMSSLRYDTMRLFASALLSYHFYNISNQLKRKQRICIPLLSLSIRSASYLFFLSFWHWYSQYKQKNICSICMRPATTLLQKSILFFNIVKTLFILLNTMQPA